MEEVYHHEPAQIITMIGWGNPYDDEWYYPWQGAHGEGSEYDDNYDEIVNGYINGQEKKLNLDIIPVIADLILRYYAEMKEKKAVHTILSHGEYAAVAKRYNGTVY